jgi:hypothetical protein
LCLIGFCFFSLFCQDSQRCFLIFFSKNEQFQFSFFFCNIIVRNNIMCVWTCIRWPCVVCFCCRIGSGFLTNFIIDILFFFFYMYIICTAYCVVCNVVCILKSSCSSRPIVFSGNKNDVVFLVFFLIFLARILRVVGN